MYTNNNKAAASATPTKLFYGWWIVIANAAITFYVAGTFFYSFGAFINPLKNAFGWSTAQISLAFSIRSAEAGPIAPLAGHVVDRFGARAVTIFGVFVTGLGFLLLSRINSLAAFYIVYTVIALGTSLCLTITPMTNIANWFIKKRGRALGLFAVGAGLGGIMVPLITWLIDFYGWRITLVLIAIGTWVICLPLAILLRHRPEKYNLLPDGDTPSNEEVTAEEVEGCTTREALKYRSFWLLSSVFLISTAALNAVTIFLIPFLTDPKEQHGLALAGGMAGAAVTIMTLSSLAGRFAAGWLSDFYSQRNILIGLFALQAAGLLALAAIHSVWHLVPFFLLFASSYGGIIALRPVILASYFGRRCVGTIHGLVLGLGTTGGVLAPIFVGSLRDTTDGYRWPFFLLALITAMSIPLLLMASRPLIPRMSKIV